MAEAASRAAAAHQIDRSAMCQVAG